MWLAEIFYTSINFIAWLYVSYNIVVNIRTIFSDKVGIIRSEFLSCEFQWCVNVDEPFRNFIINSGGFRGGSGGSNELPLEPKLFHFHEFPETLVKLHKSNPPPPQLIWTPDPLNKALLGYCLDVSDSPVLFCVSHFRSFYSLFLSYNRSWGQGWVPVKLV